MKRILIAGSFLCIVLHAGFASAQIAGDSDSLRLVGKAIAANMDSITTWKGVVTIADNRATNTIVEFTYASDDRNLVFSAVQKKADNSGVLKWKGLRTANSYVREGPQELGAHSKLIIIDDLSSERPGFFSPDFDPFVFMSVAGKDPVDWVRFFYENREEAGLANVSVTRSSALVTVTNGSSDGNLSWQYVFDLERGGLPVHVRGTSKTPATMDSWKNSYQQVDGVWLPAKSEITRGKDGKTVARRVLHWSDNELNRKIDPAIFTMETFTVLPGKTIIDKQIGTQFTIDPDRFLKKFKEQIRVKPER